MKLDLCIAGATGGVGLCLVRAILASDRFNLVGAVARRESGRDIGAIATGKPCGLLVEGDLSAVLDRHRPHALIDYTHPGIIKQHLKIAFDRKIPVVIGTTGFTDADFAEIDAAARKAGVGAATGNFAITAALMQHLAKIAARHVPHWEVIDYAKAEKPDVPSGTARELAEELGRVQTPRIALRDDQLYGPVAARGASFGGARVHSVRLPGNPNIVQAIFGLPGERLTITHEGYQDQSIYVAGSLLAAERIQAMTGLVRGLDTLLFGD
ncbi:MAG: 4-hydroxy-tetrahydrodipicolinate reductase [Rhodospirillales bacterium]|nr:4-hydroxy-tetrahydrodipicolinate reductase [Rhodospirillales bacterium]